MREWYKEIVDKSEGRVMMIRHKSKGMIYVRISRSDISVITDNKKYLLHFEEINFIPREFRAIEITESDIVDVQYFVMND
jgi:hypothetical protein